MKYTLGEKLGLLSPKPLRVTSTEFRHSKPCSCGRGDILYFKNGTSMHSVWDGGQDFGKLSYSDCCAQCEADNRRQMEWEFEKAEDFR